MASRRSYVIITGGPAPGRAPGRVVSRSPGRHRMGAPGTAPRYPAGPPRPAAARPHTARPHTARPDAGRRRHRSGRPRHRRTTPPSTFLVRYASLVVVLGAVAVSGWFAAAGATAFAQMVQP
jgi:hypothetical protein